MKTVLITGANKGIGFETTRQLLQAGYYVYLGSRDKGKGDEAVADRARGDPNIAVSRMERRRLALENQPFLGVVLEPRL